MKQILYDMGIFLTVRGPPNLGHCPKFGAIANLKIGEMPQIWGNSKFSTEILRRKICSQEAVIIHGHAYTPGEYSYML